MSIKKDFVEKDGEQNNGHTIIKKVKRLFVKDYKENLVHL